MFKKILGFFGKASNSPIGKVIGTFIPQVGVAGKIINKINDVTGNSFDENTPSARVKAAMESMTGEQWVELEQSENELEAIIQQEITKRIQEDTKVEAGETEIMTTMVKHEGKGGKWRPIIAMCSFVVVTICVLAIVAPVSKAIWVGDYETAKQALYIGLGMLSLMGPFILWINRYMGLRTREKEMRYAAAYNQPIRPPESKGFIGKLNQVLNG